MLASQLRRCLASAVKSKSSASSKSIKPEKQKFMKKQKMTASRDSNAMKRGNSGDRASPLITALFEVHQTAQPPQQVEELQKRTLVAKSWSKWRMLQLHNQSWWEKRFLQSKLQAMQELSQLSPLLAERAAQISYEPAPVSLKPPSETLPSDMPFS
jgi:hypothetical protein